MSLSTYLMIAAMVFVTSTVGVFRMNYTTGKYAGRAEYLFSVSVAAGLGIGMLWPLAILVFIAGRIIFHTTTKGNRP